MLRALIFAGAMVSLVGCTIAPTRVDFSREPETEHSFVKDALRPDAYPSFAAAEGNIYSCRYGIRLLSSSGFVPSKIAIFERLLVQADLAFAGREVVLERFDVYFNWRLRLLGDVSRRSDMGAIVTSMAGSAASQNQEVTTADIFALDLAPTTPRDAGNQVGCDQRHEGEYYASEVAGGNDVLVTWLGFTVDGTRHLLRTFYQFKPANSKEIGPDVVEAVRRSVQAAADAASG